MSLTRVINLPGCAGCDARHEGRPAEPVRALVLLFYRPHSDSDLKPVLNVLLLPKNVALRDLLRTRRKLVSGEWYIETPPHCKLHHQQEYSLSTGSPGFSAEVQPTKAEFDAKSYNSYFPSFQVILEKTLKNIKLFLRDCNTSICVWERQVSLSSPGRRTPHGPSPAESSSNEELLGMRSSPIEGISGPALDRLLEKLFEEKLITDYERESAAEVRSKKEKARFVCSTVRSRGDAACLKMIEFLCNMDPSGESSFV